jgi:AcrR family transcriptional regulator
VAQRQDVDDGIADATLALLRTKGPRSVTVESVAARSGIAKTTIYRRYRDRRDMLSAALSRVTTPEPLAVQADPPGRLRWLIKEAVKTVEVGIGYGGLAALLTDEDPAFTKLIRSLLVQHRRALADRLQQESKSKQIRSDLDVETVLDCIVGAYLAERARSGSVKAGWADRVLRTLWPALTTSRAPQR